MAHFRPKKLISGGQTGADRAGLDVALELGIPHGGWCPAGRRAEDGAVPAQYLLQETTSSSYVPRTDRNIRDSDATVIFTFEAELSGGTKRTARVAAEMGRPMVVLRPAGDPAAMLREWLESVRPEVLNVAGPRESKSPGIHEFAAGVLRQILGGSQETSPERISLSEWP